MGEPKVSVIVPVFNGRGVLEQCLDSLLAQTLKRIEIIVVDDGSNDGTAQICARYASLDQRIVFLRQVNKGVSSARNTALDVAKGEYLAFADADDIVPQWGIEQLYKTAVKKDLDMVIGSYYVHGVEDIIIVQPVAYSTVNAMLCSFLSGHNHSALWNKLIKRSFFGMTRFPDDIRYAEDQFILVELLLHQSPLFIFDPVPVYSHRVSNQSATRSGGRSILDLLEAKIKIGEMISRSGHQSDFHACFMEGARSAIIYVVKNVEPALSSEVKYHIVKYAGSLRALGLPIKKFTFSWMITILASLPEWMWRFLFKIVYMAGKNQKNR